MRAAHAALVSGPLGAKLAIVLAACSLAALVALFAFLALFGVLLGGQARGQTVSCGLSGQGQTAVPAELVATYESAAGRYRLGERGVPVLAAINRIESGFGQNMGPSSAGAIGWMQFMPATWAAYGVDADGDGRRDPYDPDDAIHAAARCAPRVPRATGTGRSSPTTTPTGTCRRCSAWPTPTRAPAR